MKRLFILLIAFCAIGSISSTAQAKGKLFPPEGTVYTGACASNKVLKWTGNSLRCADPLENVTITCSSSQYMAGIRNGEPVCKSLPKASEPAPSTPTPTPTITTKKRYCSYRKIKNRSYGCSVQCRSGETMTGGGSRTGFAFKNGTSAAPYKNGYKCSAWITGCSSNKTEPCGSTCYAICSTVK